eukprot:Sspe_Gene.8423::Locus_2865_Transcript_1_1_Confidence_1.000_Length_5789::g.8423::m.8423/K13947/PIN; auxin efflux carrier family
MAYESDYSNMAVDVVHVCAPLLFIMFLGWLVGYLRVWEADPMVTISQLNSFMFFLGIPSLLFKGLAQRDLTTLDWDFFKAFLLLRIITMVLAAGYAFGESWYYKRAFSIGNFLLHWIGIVWINTVIFGIPVLQALYGPSTVILNILAAMSSLLFQLPLMLFLFEWRASVKKVLELSYFFVPAVATADPEEGKKTDPYTESDSQVVAVGKEGSQASTERLWEVTKVVGRKLVRNPPLLGICIGLAYSGFITSLTDKKPTEFHDIPNNLATWLGDTVQPLASFSAGMYVNVVTMDVVRRTWKYAVVYTVVKLLIVPFIMIPCIEAFDITGMPARAAMHISALPIAMASMVLSKTYFNDATIYSLTIILGTVLILPTALLWEALLNEMDIWEVPSAANAVVPVRNATSTLTI